MRVASNPGGADALATGNSQLATESAQRAAVIAEAQSWMRTPFIHAAKLKGIGADCETFICEVFAKAGVFTAQGVPYVPQQWFLNTKQELYLNYLSKYATEYSQLATHNSPLPGDVICVKTRWVYSHGAIVLEWPFVIHCYPPCVMRSNVFTNPVFAGHELKFFNPWIKPGSGDGEQGTGDVSNGR
jgi:cell wall-associated NlpC family hydrolase